jgi:MGT family glycosyltransferase
MDSDTLADTSSHMGKFLFVTPPFAGHINPTVSVGSLLRRAGHEAAWVGYQRIFRTLLPADATVFALEDNMSDGDLGEFKKKAYATIGLGAVKFLYEEVLIPFGRAMLPGVLDAIDTYRPDVLVVDNQAFAGVVAAEKKRLPWATFATTSATFINPYKELFNPLQWMDDAFTAFFREYDSDGPCTGVFSTRLVVTFSTPELIGAAKEFPPHYQFVGPAINDRPAEVAFPWDALAKDVPRVLVTLGTLNIEAGERFFGEVFDALGSEPLQVVLVASDEVLVNLKNRIPANFIVRSYVPQLALLPHMNAVLCHGGHNTVAESLLNGLPIVGAPIRDDQFIISSQVENAGAGIKLNFRRANALKIRTAVSRVLAEPSFRTVAEQIRDSFVNAGGSERAAALLEELL